MLQLSNQEKRSLAICALLEAPGWSTGLNISRKHFQTSISWLNTVFEVKKGLKGLFLHWEVIANKQTLPYFVLPSGLLLCGGYALLSRQELCRIYALFWSGFDADFYADIEDFVQILCRFLHKKCSLEALFWSLGLKAEAPACGCFEGTYTSLRVPGDAKMVLEWAIKLKNRVINQERMFSTDIQPCGSS